MDLEQFDSFILVPTLSIIGLFSEAARLLMLGTALIESDLIYLEQKGPGKGFGIYSIEALTHKDIQRYLNKYENARLKERCLAACFYTAVPSDDALIHNLRYATVIARLKYWMQKEDLPAADDAQGLANYHKKYYNTAKGLTDVKGSVKVFERLIQEFKE